MAKGTKKATKRVGAFTRKRIHPFSTRNLRSALMNIHKNVVQAEHTIKQKIENTKPLAPRASKMRYLNTLKAERHIKEQIKQKKNALKKNIDDITMLFSKL
jgi:uncharacterized protein YwgA